MIDGTFQMVLAEMTFVQVLGLMVNNSVHRIYVVHEENQAMPQHSVTPTDIMQMLSLLHT